MGLSQARPYFEQQSSAAEDEDKPTFLFGALARAQLVEPIEGDNHFENVNSSLEELFAGKAQDTKVVLKRTGLTDDEDYPASTRVLHTEKRNQEPGENRVERITITL